MKTLLSLLIVLLFSSLVVNAQNLHNSANAASIENEANATAGWAGNAAITSSTTNPQNGTYSLLITQAGTGREARYTFTAIVGTVYNISIWARQGSPTNQPAFANWTGFSGFTTRTITSGTWTQYNFTVTATATNPIIRVYSSPSGSAAGMQVFIDAVSILAQGGGGGDTQAPTAPSNLVASNTTSTSTSLTWSASTDNVGVTGYTIRRNNVAVGTVAGNVTSFNATGLSASTTYSFNVVATDAANNTSAASNTIQATTLSGGGGADTQAPTAPANLTASGTTSTSTNLSWNPSTDNIGVTGYTIRRNNQTVGNVAGNVTSFIASGLTASTTYSFDVVANDAANNTSAASNSVQVTTLAGGGGTDTQAPTAPANLTASGTTSTSTNLSWNPSTDNVGVTGYTIRRNNQTVGNVAGNVTSYIASGLTASTTYSFNVVATDAANNTSAASNTVQVTTSSSGGGGSGTAYTTSNANLPTVDWQARNLYASGVVGIGTNPNSAFQLSVNGDIRAKEIVVESGWSDFVFEPGYNLPSLAEVEQHIIEKGHLKDIPSASVVKEHGIGLAEMNTLLLQKIEEMTLYLISMDKQIKNLEADNLQLKEAIDARPSAK